jgi:hypothetical protein
MSSVSLSKGRTYVCVCEGVSVLARAWVCVRAPMQAFVDEIVCLTLAPALPP